LAMKAMLSARTTAPVAHTIRLLDFPALRIPSSRPLGPT
jgi:hypothetical protein